MMSRDRAEMARDQAEHHIRRWELHRNKCEECAVSIPCLEGMTIRQTVNAAVREARDALTAYMPPGTPVTYHGPNPAYTGHTWIVDGAAPNHPHAGYTVRRARHFPVTVPLSALRLTRWEEQSRARYALVRDAVATVQAIMSRYGLTLSVDVDRQTSGRVIVAWSSAALHGAEQEAKRRADAKAWQYITAAVRLLTDIRSATARDHWVGVTHAARNAKTLAKHARVTVERSE